jgi:hypothetical protein
VCRRVPHLDDALFNAYPGLKAKPPADFGKRYANIAQIAAEGKVFLLPRYA